MYVHLKGSDEERALKFERISSMRAPEPISSIGKDRLEKTSSLIGGRTSTNDYNV